MDDVEYPPYEGDERTQLRAWLDFNREACIRKVRGVTEEQARSRQGPSKTSLIGVLNHLAHVEHWWFHLCFTGSEPAIETYDDDLEYDVGEDLTTDDVIAKYRAQIDRSTMIEGAAASLEQRAAHDRVQPTLRWIMVHMIEETARHAGHLDITRELVDGAVGR
ncbi:MAG: DinB family protein [Actinomycetota bacterium]|nr:DinB family protein [Actinomycetota bacterium]